ncbi:MAG: hypothetical protein ACOVS5_00620 [Oligoflexus sp.]
MQQLSRNEFVENDARAWTLGLVSLFTVAAGFYRIVAEEVHPDG